MFRLLVCLLVLTAPVACSKNKEGLPPVVIPDLINGPILEVHVTPLNITTPDKGSLLISMNNTIYKVEFNAIAQSQSNAILSFASDTILRDDSREFANLGKDAIAYNPVGPNEITISFNDGRKIFGWFDPNTSFGGDFGQDLISKWRDPTDPAKPNQKAKDDISKFVKFYSDIDGPGPGVTPVYLLVRVSKQ